MKRSGLRRSTTRGIRAATIAVALAVLLLLTAWMSLRLYRAQLSGPLLLSKQQVLQQLTVNKPLRYRVKLNSGQYVKLLIEEPSGKTVATLRYPDGGMVSEFQSPPGSPITVSLIAEKSGEYRLELSAQGQELGVKNCIIRVEELRQATLKDRRLVKAEESFLKAERLRAEWKAELNREAIENYRVSLEEWQSSEEWREAARASRAIAEVYHLLGEPVKALEFYAQSLQFSVTAGDVIGQVDAHNGMTQTLIQSGELIKAREACSDAERLSRATGYVRGLAMAINSMGELSAASGEHRGALVRYDEALRYWAGTNDIRGAAQTHLNVGMASFYLGDLTHARSELQQALEFWRAAGDRRGEALTLVFLGTSFSMRGEKQEALGMYEKARKLLRPMGDKVSEASLMSGMAYLYNEFGDLEKALQYRKEQLSLWREVNFRVEYAVTLMQVGELTHSLGQSQDALEYFHQARSAFVEIKERRLEAHVVRDLGVVYESLGRTAVALAFYRRARALCHAQGDRRWEAFALNNMGGLQRRLGRWRLAHLYLEEALRFSRVVEDRVGESLAQYNLARLKRDLGRLAEARSHIEASLDLTELMRARVASADLRTTLAAAVRQRYEFYVALLMQMHVQRPKRGNDALALQASERARARGLLDLLGEARADIHQGVSPELLEQRRELQQSINAEAERLMREAGGGKETATIKAKVNNLVTKLQETETQIRSSSPQYAALVLPQPLTVKEIQQEVLDGDTILLEYALGDERSYLWTVTQTSLTSYELPKRAEIEKTARAAYDLLREPQPRREEFDRQFWQKASELSQMILGPVAKQLGTKRLLIAAEGALQYIPFAALPSPVSRSGQPRVKNESDVDALIPLIERHEVVSMPSASALAALRRETGHRKSAEKSVAVIADPVFNQDDIRVIMAGKKRENTAAEEVQMAELRKTLRDFDENGAGLKLPRLYASIGEADAILGLVPVEDRLKVVGFEANRTKVMSPAISKYRIVHFATHGLLNSEHPELSGIVLSLFDERGKPQDGFLRLHDIYNLKLPAELVVLSACSTALGKEVKGEGLIGLTRGFMYAGAPRVVASLWKVDDEATSEFMKLFYQQMLRKGKSPAAALRDAQREFRQMRRWDSPYYWAAFVMQGEWK